MTRIIWHSPRKPSAAPGHQTRVIPNAAQQAVLVTQQQISDAEQAAAAVLADAHQRAEQLIDQARGQASHILLQAQQSAARQVAQALAPLTDLAVKIAEKLLCEQLKATPETITSIVKNCLAQETLTAPVTIRVHPDDVAHVVQVLPTGSETYTCVPDDQIRRGGCIVESAELQLDAQLETQLTAIKAALSAAGSADA